MPFRHTWLFWSTQGRRALELRLEAPEEVPSVLGSLTIALASRLPGEPSRESARSGGAR